jgi:pyridinium-3,5-bisthiocarboxylic acid mononucleotide nickel chelatase
MRHLHLDPIGGVAGDMFVAALLDAEPQHEGECIRAAEAVAHVPCRLLRHRDSVLAGARFSVRVERVHDHEYHHQHAHAAWHDIRARLHEAPLPATARRHALGIFAGLAEAEARVHGIEPEAVTFHEVGAADSIADIVAAAWLIAAQSRDDADATWSVAPLPLGYGQVDTAHGILPLPAPATALLLAGFAVIDDRVGGERVTPTGAAILKYLGAQTAAPGGVRRLLHTGIGFGTRSLPGRSNVLRVLVTESDPVVLAGSAGTHRPLSIVSFEVDDQTAEDLAAGLDRLRLVDGVHDVLQMPAFGKKNRMSAHVQVLVAPESLESAVEACFRETSTIGLRTQSVQGRALSRSVAEVAVDGRSVRVKRVERPGGATGKAECDDLRDVVGHAARARLRRAAERLSDE